MDTEKCLDILTTKKHKTPAANANKNTTALTEAEKHFQCTPLS